MFTRQVTNRGPTYREERKPVDRNGVLVRIWVSEPRRNLVIRILTTCKFRY